MSEETKVVASVLYAKASEELEESVKKDLENEVSEEKAKAVLQEAKAKKTS